MRFERGFTKRCGYVSLLPARFGRNKKQETTRRLQRGSERFERNSASVYGHARFSDWLGAGEKDAPRSGGCIHFARVIRPSRARCERESKRDEERERERERERTRDFSAEVTALRGRVILSISHQEFSTERSPANSREGASSFRKGRFRSCEITRRGDVNFRMRRAFAQTDL